MKINHIIRLALVAGVFAATAGLRAQLDYSGLWVGSVEVASVNEAVGDADPAILTPTASTATLRLLVHVDDSGTIRLLKGITAVKNDAGGVSLVTDDSLLVNYPGPGKRFGSVAFDFGDGDVAASAYFSTSAADAAGSAAAASETGGGSDDAIAGAAFTAAEGSADANSDALVRAFSAQAAAEGAIQSSLAATEANAETASVAVAELLAYYVLANTADAFNGITGATGIAAAETYADFQVFKEAIIVQNASFFNGIPGRGDGVTNYIQYAFPDSKASESAATAQALGNARRAAFLLLTRDTAELIAEAAASNTFAENDVTGIFRAANVAGNLDMIDARTSDAVETAALPIVAAMARVARDVSIQIANFESNSNATQAENVAAIAANAIVDVAIESAANATVGSSITMRGDLAPSSTLEATIIIGADHPTNPFKHFRHPDHTTGYTIRREVSLVFDNLSEGQIEFGGGYGVDRISGTFNDEIFGLHKPLGQSRDVGLRASGPFTLFKVSDIATLNN